MHKYSNASTNSTYHLQNIHWILLIWWWCPDILERPLKCEKISHYWCDFQKKKWEIFSNFLTFAQLLNFMKFLPCLDWCQWLFASLKFVWQNLNHKALFYPFSIYSVCASWSYEFVSFGKSFWLFASLLVPFSSLQRKRKCWNCQKVGNAIPSAGSYMY